MLSGYAELEAVYNCIVGTEKSTVILYPAEVSIVVYDHYYLDRIKISEWMQRQKEHVLNLNNSVASLESVSP